MELENLKRWHWALLGLLVGVGFAYFWQGTDPDSDRHISQTEFERESQSKSRQTGKPLLQNVVVQPPVLDYQKNQVQVVTGLRLRLDVKTKQEVRVPFAYIAKVPYHVDIVPQGAEPKATWTVTDYLAAVHQTNPELQYRFGWEAKPGASMAIGAGIGLVVIGGIWPTCLNLLIGAGLGRPASEREEKKYDLSRVKNTKSKPVPVKKVASIEDQRRLDALNESLESQLEGAGLFTPAATAAAEPEEPAAAPAAQPMRPLTETPLEPAAVTAQTTEEKQETFDELRKRYAGGAFYPVAKGPAKKE